MHILLMQGHPFVSLIVWLFLFCQMDGQECLRTPSSYLWFSRLKLYSCYITKFDQVRFEPLCVRSTRSPRFIIDLNFQNLFVHFDMTEWQEAHRSFTQVRAAKMRNTLILLWCVYFSVLEFLS